MNRTILWMSTILALSSAFLHAQQDGSPADKDVSQHTVRLVEVEKGVKLEVLDWGGSGQPVIFLAGNPFTAHDFDNFAPKLIAGHHVYGITRRGFGASSAPVPENGNYSADRLGDDVIAVIDSLHLDRPVLVGHSLAGEELSSIGSRHPEAVSGLVYLDAGYGYAYYDRKQGDLILDSIELRKKLELFLSAKVPDLKTFLVDLQADLPRYENELREQQKLMALLPPQPPRSEDPDSIQVALSAGRQKYTEIRVPVLAIFAAPHNERGAIYPNDPAAREAVLAYDRASTTAQAEAFKTGVPSAHVVLLPNATHFVFKSNETDVLREIDAFLSTLH